MEQIIEQPNRQITKTGYGILKSTLTDKEIMDTIADLTVKPLIAPDYDFGSLEEYPVYRQNSNYLYVPKYYGISNFGPAITKERIGKNLSQSIRFRGLLRDDQETFVSKLKEKIENDGSCICNSATGAGKTVMALNLVHYFKKKTLVIVHKQFLLDQWSERIKQYLPDLSIGQLKQDIIDTDKDIVIGMLQSISMKNYDTTIFDEFGFVIIDEVHHICSRTFSRALFKVSTKLMLGLSATPKRKDGLTKVLNWFLSDIIVKDAIDQNIDKPEVKFIYAQTNNIDVKYNFKNKINIPDLITKLSLDTLRNEQIVDEIISLSEIGRSIILLSDRRQHLEDLKNMLENKNFKKPVGLYVGSLKQEQLNEANKCPVILATYQIASEGYDNPFLDTIILGTPKSDIVQSIGRVMRRKNKFHPLIVDIVDMNYRAGQYRVRKKYYTDQGFIINKNKETTIDESNDD